MDTTHALSILSERSIWHQGYTILPGGTPVVVARIIPSWRLISRRYVGGTYYRPGSAPSLRPSAAKCSCLINKIKRNVCSHGPKPLSYPQKVLRIVVKRPRPDFVLCSQPQPLFLCVH